MNNTNTKDEIAVLQELGILELCNNQVTAFVAVNALQELTLRLAAKLNLSTSEVKEMRNQIIAEMKQKHEDRAVGVRASLERKGMPKPLIDDACANPYIMSNTILLEFLNSTAG